MRITDSMMFDRASSQLGTSRSANAEATDQMSSGRRVNHPWDAPADAGQIVSLGARKSQFDAIGESTSRAARELEFADGALEQINGALSRAQELAVQLASDTYNATDRARAGLEVTQLAATVISALNARFGDRYIFGGFKDGTPPFDATGAYAGDGNVRSVEIAPGVQQPSSVQADAAFKGVGGGIDVPGSLNALAAALAGNNPTQIRAGVQDMASAISQIAVHRSRAGAAWQVLDSASTTSRALGDATLSARGAIEDVDPFLAATRLAATQHALEATLTATAKEFQLSLVNKL